ncbi:hypothetical protein STRATTON_119 [Erwinia phage vB_EamM_Stratton]|uniref:Uncharacterized protein n=2 Tax=Erskinevirus EaH2 TaxID=2169883 RepID=A0A1B2IH34_9CAUD|nr:hypothetical protein G173_gp024 [Erwinia phage phiEaH2]AFQ96569.1 hypothetical protein [Erwinia phage phiEaH2]ANZ50544.1 hypothetical protein STRATTON_119 [Erwinia phage vB_EamM_Stratton]
MLEANVLFSKDGKKTISLVESKLKSRNPDFKHYNIAITDLETNETWPFATHFQTNSTISDEENKARAVQAYMNELGILFFKLIARKDEAREAYIADDWEKLAELCPRYIITKDFLEPLSLHLLGTPWVHPPVSHSRKATLNFRANHKGVLLVATCKLGWSHRAICSDQVTVTYDFSLQSGTVNDFRDVGYLQLRHHYQNGNWPTLKQFMTESRVERVIDAWLLSYKNFPASGSSVQMTPVPISTLDNNEK